MSTFTQMRLDKFLWSVRLFKTRSQAALSCKGDHILVNEKEIKPATEIATGNVIQLKKGGLKWQYKIVDLPKSRVSAKLVPQFLEDITPTDQAEKNRIILENKKENLYDGVGRPTKLNRRKIDKWKDKHYGFNE